MAPPADNTTKYDTELTHTLMQDEKHKEARKIHEFHDAPLLYEIHTAVFGAS